MTTTDLHPSEAAYYASIRAGSTWHAAAEKAMAYLASEGKGFTSDDLRELLADCGEPPTPNAYGGLFHSWARQQLIRTVGYSNSTGVKRRGGLNRVWRGAGN